MRAFVAIMPPAAVLAELAEAVTPLRAAQPGLRWTPPAQWHLTLAFLGEIDEGVLPELGERLARAARRHPPPTLAFGGGGRFGDRVLWVRVHVASSGRSPGESAASPGRAPRSDRPSGRESPASPGRVPRSDSPSGRESPASPGRVPRSDWPRDGEGLRRLAASVTAAARRCGIALDDRPYRPHLTLARSRDGVDLRLAVTQLAGFVGTPWTAEALHLVRSRLGAGPGGVAQHEVAGTWPLGRTCVPPGPTNGPAAGT